MQADNQPVWSPPGDWRTSTLLGELTQRLGVEDYDALLDLSIKAPARYWDEVMHHLQFVWRTSPKALRDANDDPAFPHWFPGGRLNWVDSVFRHARGELAGQPAFLAEDEAGQITTVTFGDLPGRVLAIAAGLRDQGVNPGDRVGLMMPMNAHAALSLLAIAAMGAIAVPLFSGFAAEAAISRLRLAQAGFLIASASYFRRGREVRLDGTLANILTALPELTLFVDGTTQLPNVVPWAKLVTASRALIAPREMGSADAFMIVFTSGTTGQPKGTVHTHGGFPLKLLHDAAYHFELRARDRWLWPSDMGWIVGPITVIGSLSRGVTLVCYDGAPDHPGPGRLAALIERHRVTHFGASPTLVRSLAASGATTRDSHLQSLKVLILAGEVIDPEHFHWFFNAFGSGRLPIINYTGGTEASGALLANVPVRPIKPCGFNSASPGVDAYVSDDAGNRLSDSAGELVVAAPFVGMTQSFWNAPERYLDAYWVQRPGLWSHGDLVRQDIDGHFFVLGRADDTLKIAGKRLGPSEVEDILLDLLQVSEVAAVGLHDPVKGQRLVLCVVTTSTDTLQLDSMISARVEQALGKPFRPAMTYFVPQLPKTRNGKVMRRVIRSLLEGGPPGDLSSIENPAAIEFLRDLRISR